MTKEEIRRARWALACHGGAGRIPKDLNRADATEIRRALQRALSEGARILRSGGPALDAVQFSTRIMEDSGVLNAGCGAVLNSEGYAELDASIMRGADRSAGAVAATRSVKNPIDLARDVMQFTPHVLLVGEGAEKFAQERGYVPMPPDYFITPRRKKELAVVQEKERRAAKGTPKEPLILPTGTVGAVALDRRGDLAAATSTGGTTSKHLGRVGDSALIGAGTYAENDVCAVSTTGIGEYFIRAAAAAAVAARMKFAEQQIDVAAQEVINDLTALGGRGGLIAVDAAGSVAMPFSSETMLRGFVVSGARPKIWL